MKKITIKIEYDIFLSGETIAYPVPKAFDIEIKEFDLENTKEDK